MTGKLGARLLLLASCLVLLKLTGCPSPRRPDPGPGVTPGPGPTPNAVTPGPTVPEPAAPTGVRSKAQCPLDGAGRTCDLTQTEDGGPPPTPHPCQVPRTGECDPRGEPMCLFRWRADGEPCNNNLGVCQGRKCKCNSDRSCGYDCTQTCDAGSSCQTGTCVAASTPPPVCGGCAHSSQSC